MFLFLFCWLLSYAGENLPIRLSIDSSMQPELEIKIEQPTAVERTFLFTESQLNELCKKYGFTLSDQDRSNFENQAWRNQWDWMSNLFKSLSAFYQMPNDLIPVLCGGDWTSIEALRSKGYTQQQIENTKTKILERVQLWFESARRTLNRNNDETKKFEKENSKLDLENRAFKDMIGKNYLLNKINVDMVLVVLKGVGLLILVLLVRHYLGKYFEEEC